MSFRILILGGSSEGFQLARQLEDSEKFEPLTSFAGVTKTRRPVAGASRVGGFGGAEGLRDFIQKENIAALLDATHPFASIMKHNAQSAAQMANIPCLHVLRPEWRPREGEEWITVRDMDEAARAIPQGASPTFLTVGRTELAPFARRRDIVFLARVIDAPQNTADFAHLELVLARGPFDVKTDMALFKSRKIACLVSKNSGGESAASKLVCARRLGIPVVMVNRPAPPEGEIAETPAQAVNWLEARFNVS
ncbi:MAG TPA: cobalt-precorrin-6A reductase [Rhizobiales bacterium]|nr:cobalt-precorrin-6A reductase [Hyphomicrobiales bacterium]